MALPMTCRCGKEYRLKDEWLGRLVECPDCRGVMRVERMTRAQAHAVFERDVFLLRQQHLSISEEYQVCDPEGRPLLFVERPLHARNAAVLAVSAACLVLAVLLVPPLIRASDLPAFAAGPAAIAFVWLAYYLPSRGLGRKRNITVFSDESRQDKLFEITQEDLFDFPEIRYSLREPSGEARFVFIRVFVDSLLRKFWRCKGADGEDVLWAKEDSVILSLLRRLMGPFFGLLRTNFILLTPYEQAVVGELNRKVTLLDRYVLDLSVDRGRTVDRRVALAFGILLDTGEGR